MCVLQAMCTALSLKIWPFAEQEPEAQALFDLLQSVKRAFRSCAPKAEHLPCLKLYPLLPRDLPDAHFRSAYDNELPVMIVLDHFDFRSAGMSLRNSNKRVRVSGPTRQSPLPVQAGVPLALQADQPLAPLQGMMHMMQQCMLHLQQSQQQPSLQQPMNLKIYGGPQAPSSAGSSSVLGSTLSLESSRRPLQNVATVERHDDMMSPDLFAPDDADAPPSLADEQLPAKHEGVDEAAARVALMEAEHLRLLEAASAAKKKAAAEAKAATSPKGKGKGKGQGKGKAAKVKGAGKSKAANAKGKEPAAQYRCISEVSGEAVGGGWGCCELLSQ